MKERTQKFTDTEFYHAIKDRLTKQNRNWLCVITGDTGSGKSYTALRLAELLDSNFSIANVAFEPREFISLIKNGRPNNNGGFTPLERGSLIIFDEAGVGMASRQWYTVQNQLLGYLLQTFRYTNHGVIFTVPDLSFIDVQARRLFHNYFKSQGVDYEHGQAQSTIYALDHNDWVGKTYRHSVKYGDDDFTIWGFSKPSEKLIQDYERKKAQYAESLYQGALDTIDAIAERKVSKGLLIEQKLRAGKPPLEIADELKVSVKSVLRARSDLITAGARVPGGA